MYSPLNRMYFKANAFFKCITFSDEGDAVKKYFFSETLDESKFYKPGEIIKSRFIFKMPHQHAVSPVSFEVFPSSMHYIKICSLKVRNEKVLLTGNL